jgi:hypothetical protein
VRNCEQIIPKYMDMILEILQGNVRSENDLEVRIDTHVLIEHIIGIQKIHEDLRQYSVSILKNILIPSIRWKIGSPEAKIRKAGILNIVTLITLELIDSKGILSITDELLPPLKDCLSDDR